MSDTTIPGFLLGAVPTPEPSSLALGGRGNSIGRAYALGLAAAGAAVVVADIKGEGAKAVADEVLTAGGKAIFLRFDAHGSLLLDEMTTRLRGHYVAVLINNHPVSAWLVDQRIINGQFLIEGDFTDEEAKKAVDDLNKLSKKNTSR